MEFDPYYRWFGIPPERQPPDLYTLLGLVRFENDAVKINAAALDRLAVLRKHQTGRHQDLSQQLMNEVAQARLRLSEPARKAQYDLELQLALEKLSGSAPSARRPTAWLSVVAVLVLVAGLGSVAAVLWSRTGSDKSDEHAVAKDVRPSVDAEQNAAPTSEPPKSQAAPPAENPTVPKPSGMEIKAATKSPASEAPVAGFRLTTKFPAPTAEVAALYVEDDLARRVGPFLTPKDEKAPVVVSGDGRWMAYFAGDSPGKLHWLHRQKRQDPFLELGEWSGLPLAAGGKGMAISVDGSTCWFASAGTPGLFTAKRATVDAAWGPATPVLGEDGPIQGEWPAVAQDGRALFFVAKTADGPTIVVADRAALDKPFSKPTRVGLPVGFTEPAVTADGAVLYASGPTAQGAFALYRSRRGSNGKWSKPEPLRTLRGFAGDRPAHDRTPAVTHDGKRLYFASDRDGGSGGYDLWTVQAPPFDEPVDLIAMANGKDAGETEPPAPTKKPNPTKESNSKPAAKSKIESDPKRPPVQMETIVKDWLILGPVPVERPPTQVADLMELGASTVLRKFPKLDDKLLLYDLSWRRESTPGRQGVFFLASWIVLPKSAEARLAVTHAPGGGVAWLDDQKHELTWNFGNVRRVLHNELRASEPFRLGAGRHRIVVTLQVAQLGQPLYLQLYKADADEPLEGYSSGLDPIARPKD